MSENVLFITSTDISERSSGAGQCTGRNYRALVKYFGATNVEVYNLYQNYLGNRLIDKFRKRTNLLMGRFFGLSAHNEGSILQRAKGKDWVFIDTSRYGRLAKRIKQFAPKTRVVTFFHNIEYDYTRQEFSGKGLSQLSRIAVLRLNETWACRHSDKVIVLNERDRDLLKTLYHRDADALIPISFPEHAIIPSTAPVSHIPNGLFLGSNFFANRQGIQWFVEQVLPHANMTLTIIGRGMNTLPWPTNPKLNVAGFVDDLEPSIQNTDFMVFPILVGGGMKVKTCESLMYGKNIIGSPEAFQGYNLDVSRVGACCQSASDFISAINALPQHFPLRYNAYARSVFVNHYSDQAVFGEFERLFSR